MSENKEATQRIDNDLTRFNAKVLKLNYPGEDVYESEEETKEKVSTKKRCNKPAADSSSEDEETLKNKYKREKQQSENRNALVMIGFVGNFFRLIRQFLKNEIIFVLVFVNKISSHA